MSRYPISLPLLAFKVPVASISSWPRVRSTSSCVTDTGRQMARLICDTLSRFIRNIVLIRMSRIMAMGSNIASRLRGAGGAVTVDVCKFIVLPIR